MTSQESAELQILQWQRYKTGVGRDTLLVKMLRERLLSSEQVAEVLNILDIVCTKCFDHERPCYCDDDE